MQELRRAGFLFAIWAGPPALLALLLVLMAD